MKKFNKHNLVFPDWTKGHLAVVVPRLPFQVTVHLQSKIKPSTISKKLALLGHTFASDLPPGLPRLAPPLPFMQKLLPPQKLALGFASPLPKTHGVVDTPPPPVLTTHFRDTTWYLSLKY